MSNDGIQFPAELDLPPGLVRIIQSLEGLESQGTLVASILLGMDRANEFVVANMIEYRLKGKGPFPVEDARLGVKTRRLSRAMRSTPSQIMNNQTVVGYIGNDVIYYGPHEEGFDGTVRVPGHKVDAHTRKTASGRNSRVREHQRRGHERQMKLPARKMLQTELQHARTAEAYRREVGQEAMEVIRNLPRK